MGCCSVRRRRGRTLIVPAVSWIIVAIAGGAILSVLAVASLAVPALREQRRRFWKEYVSLERGLARRLLDDPFLFNSEIRARWSGRVMRRSPALGGWVYRYFNVLVAVWVLPLIGLAGFAVHVIVA